MAAKSPSTNNMQITKEVRARELLPKAFAEQWTVRKFKEESGISLSKAHEMLKNAAEQRLAKSDEEMDSLSEEMKREAKRARKTQIRRNEDFERLIERKLEEMMAKKGVDTKELQGLVNSRDVHWRTTSKITGIEFAEKAAAAKAGSSTNNVMISMGEMVEGKDFEIVDMENN